MDIRGGKAAGGNSGSAPGYGYESSNARHDQTYFLYDVSRSADGSPIAVIGWEEAQNAWGA